MVEDIRTHRSFSSSNKSVPINIELCDINVFWCWFIYFYILLYYDSHWIMGSVSPWRRSVFWWWEICIVYFLIFCHIQSLTEGQENKSLWKILQLQQVMHHNLGKMVINTLRASIPKDMETIHVSLLRDDLLLLNMQTMEERERTWKSNLHKILTGLVDGSALLNRIIHLISIFLKLIYRFQSTHP